MGLKHSLGYLNQPFGPPQATPQLGDPQSPFPWLTFNGRPFVNPLELLLVPTCSSSKLLVNAGTAASSHDTTDANYNKYFNFLKAQPVLTTPAVNPYSPAYTNGLAVSTSVELLPVHDIAIPAGSGTRRSSTGFWNIWACPRRLWARKRRANPCRCAGAPGPIPAAVQPDFAYREPGRINLNTIYGDASATATQPPPVWQGLMAGFPDLNSLPARQKFVASRRGSPGNILDPPASAAYPRNLPGRSVCSADGA